MRIPREQDLDVDAELAPLDYPGQSIDYPALIRYGRLTPMNVAPGRLFGQAKAWSRLADRVRFDRLNQELVRENVPSMDARTLVVAVGSNSSPLVLQRKFLDHHVSVLLPIVPCKVTGIGVGHSAHVSRPGYIAATPFARPGEVTPLHASWLDPAQLRVLDATEPNYVRCQLSATDFPIEISGSSGHRPIRSTRRSGVCSDEMAFPSN